ncbi:MAG: glycosyltransferase, partial [Pseudomonadales bacterium]
LIALKLPPGRTIEVIVVDNDVAGSASLVARSRSQTLSSLRYFVEPRTNIAHARNRALHEAQGEWLMFIDDDEVADESWVTSYMALLETVECDGAFGPVIPRLEEAGSLWLDVETFYSRKRHATGTIVGSGNVRTGNAMIRRALLEGHSFDPAFGETGGSDTELFGKLCARGARFVWCDEAQVVEFIPPGRHCLGWLTQRSFRGGYVYARLKYGSSTAGFFVGLLRVAVLLSAFSILLLPAIVAGRRNFSRLWLRVCVQVGMLWSLFGGTYQEYGNSSVP